MSTTKNKTILVASYPDGHEVEIIKVPGLGWRWEHDFHSSHLDSAKAQALAAGAALVRRPNPNYRPPRLRTFTLLTGGKR